MAETYTEEWIIGPSNTNFFTRLYPSTTAEPAKASFVFIHGFQEHIARYDHVFQRVQAAGYSVFAFDQRGWGQTALNVEHKSPTSSYGLTTRPQQLGDAEFFIKRESERLGKEVPLFLWGHSMGGGVVLSFGTAKAPPPAESTLHLLSGIVVGCPLIKQATPAAKILRLAGALLARVVPWAPFPAEVKAEDLSHDPAVVAAAKKDPLMKTYGTIGGINDMLAAGDFLAAKGWQDWPKSMPLLMILATGDKICSYPAAKEFYVHVDADDKHVVEFEGAYHEVMNEPAPVWKDAVDAIVSWTGLHLEKKHAEARL